jgi:hypothetical protein
VSFSVIAVRSFPWLMKSYKFMKESQPQESSLQPKLLVPKLCESEEMSVVLRKGVQEAGEELAGFLDPAKKPRHSASAAGEEPANYVGPSKPRYSDPKPRMPLVILTFDEAHELAIPASTKRISGVYSPNCAAYCESFVNHQSSLCFCRLRANFKLSTRIYSRIHRLGSQTGTSFLCLPSQR